MIVIYATIIREWTDPENSMHPGLRLVRLGADSQPLPTQPAAGSPSGDNADEVPRPRSGIQARSHPSETRQAALGPISRVEAASVVRSGSTSPRKDELMASPR